MIQIPVILLRHLDRGGRLHQPGDRIDLPEDEATAMIETQWAVPVGAETRVPARPIVGRFVARRRWPG